MNKKNRIQVIIPAELREPYLKEVEKTGRTESGLAKHIIRGYFKPDSAICSKCGFEHESIQTPTINEKKV